MPRIDLEAQRKKLDREITFFHFKKALEIEPKRPESLYSLADTYQNLGNSAKAHRYFQQTLENIKGKSAYMYKETLQRLKNITTDYTD